MPWYRTGTVSVTLNSTTVTGTGTAFAANSRVGDAFLGPDGRWYEVTNIASDTVLSILPAYQGATAAAGTYAMAPMQGYVKASADQLRSIVASFGDKLAALGTTGNYDTLPVAKGGTGGVDQDSARAGLAAAKSGANSDITSLAGLTTSLSVAQGGMSPAYIDGLIPTWVSATSISLSPGVAYAPGLAKPLVLSNTLTLSGLSLIAGTWYYLYLFSNAGSPAIELVTTVPATPYQGTARTKAGDTSRRFIGAFLASATNTLAQFQWAGDGYIDYLESLTASPFRVAITAAGSAVTTNILLSMASVVPPTTKSCRAAVNCIPGSASYDFYFLPTNGATVGTATGNLVRYFSGGTGQSTRTIAPIPLNASQAIFVRWTNTAGGCTVDVCSYGCER